MPSGNPDGQGLQMPNGIPNGQGLTPPANALQNPSAPNNQNWLKMAQLGMGVMNRGMQGQQPMPQMNIPNGQMQQNLQSLMQPTQLMNRTVQGAMNPAAMQSLLNPQDAANMQQMQGLLH